MNDITTTVEYAITKLGLAGGEIAEMYGAALMADYIAWCCFLVLLWIGYAIAAKKWLAIENKYKREPFIQPMIVGLMLLLLLTGATIGDASRLTHPKANGIDRLMRQLTK